MISSMTAFGSGRHEFEHGHVTIELRSVNSRYLDLQFRLPDELRLAEIPLREKLSQRLTRGKIDIRVNFSKPRSLSDDRLGIESLSRIATQLQVVRQTLPDVAPPSLADILAWSDSESSSQHTDPQMWVEPCVIALEQAIDELLLGRAREGSRLAKSMLEQSKSMLDIVEQVQAHLPDLLRTQREKLAQKLLETVQNAFPGGFSHITGAELSERISSESSLFALRIDVAEELARLRSHMIELEYLLAGKSGTSAKPGGKTGGKESGSTGKRLDFLFQEMNREANTLGSKSGSLDMTRAAIDLKLLIEQMREQAQNIE